VRVGRTLRGLDRPGLRELMHGLGQLMHGPGQLILVLGQLMLFLGQLLVQCRNRTRRIARQLILRPRQQVPAQCELLLEQVVLLRQGR
jgi:hypothetical protein